LNNLITCNSVKALLYCIYSDMARERNIHKFLKREINFPNSTAYNGFPDVLRISITVQNVALAKKRKALQFVRQ